MTQITIQVDAQELSVLKAALSEYAHRCRIVQHQEWLKASVADGLREKFATAAVEGVRQQNPKLFLEDVAG